MKDSSHLTCFRNKINKGILYGIIACLVFMMASCTESNINSTDSSRAVEDMISLSNKAPSVLLSGSNFGNTMGKAAGDNATLMDMHLFTSPLFGLATAPNGDILVADAGSGVVSLNGNTDISLPGVTDMSPIGNGSIWATKGLSGDPGDQTGQALYRLANGKNRLIADLYAFEQGNNPDGAELIDSNPFDVQSLGGQSALVADAGANDLLHVDNQGNIKVKAVFPNELVSTDNLKEIIGCAEIPEDQQPPLCGLPPEIPAQPVPTSIAVGPDGNYYVGELKGFPAPTGMSSVWKISPGASWAECGSSPDCVKVFDGGFTSIIDLAFDADGALHVVELDEQSWFAVENGSGVGGTINRCDLGTGTCTEMATGIPIITAITFGNDGTLWATQNSLIPGMAEVIEIN